MKKLSPEQIQRVQEFNNKLFEPLFKKYSSNGIFFKQDEINAEILLAGAESRRFIHNTLNEGL